MDGILLEDSDLIKIKAAEFFANQFKALPELAAEHLFNITGPGVTEDQNQALAKVPDDLETRNAIFSLTKI